MNAVKLVVGLGSIIGGIQTLFEKGGDNELSEIQDGKITRRFGLDSPQGKIYNIGSIDDRISRIRTLVNKAPRDPRVRELAVAIVSRVCGSNWCIKEKDYKGELSALYKALRSPASPVGVRYVRDITNIDTYQNPLRTFDMKGGDCDDFVITFLSLAKSIGYGDTYARVIQTVNSPDWNHIYAVVGIPPQNPVKYIGIDASVPKYAGWQPPKYMIKRHKDFKI